MTKLARVGLKLTRSLNHVRDARRAAHDHDPVQLAASSQVIAIHFQTLAAADDDSRTQGEAPTAA